MQIPERERTIGVDEGLNRLKNVKVSFQLPVAAAKRLQRLNAQEPSCLRSIGILAVHVGGEHEEHDVGKDDARLIPSFSGATRRQSCEADSLATSLLRHCYSNSINNETNKRKTAARAGNGLQSRSVSSAKTSDSGISAGSSSPLLVGLLLQSGFSDGTAETSSVNISEDRSWLTGKVESSAAPVSKRRRGGSRMRKEILSPPVLNHPLKQRQQHRQLYDDSSQAREKREAIMDEVIQSVVSDMKAYSNDDNVALSDEQSGTNSNNITDLNCNAEQQMLSTDANVELPTDAVQLNREDSESLSRTILPADDLSRSDSSCLVDSNCTSSTLSNVDGTTEQVDKGQLSANIVPSEGEVDGQCTMTNGERDSTVVDVRLSNGPAPRELEKKNEDELATGNSRSGDNFEQQQQHAESTSMVTNAASVMVDDCFSDRNSFLLHAVQSDHDYTEPSLLRQQGTTAGRCSNDQQQQQEEEEEEEEEKERKRRRSSSNSNRSDSCTAKGRVLDTSVELLSDQGQGQCQWPLQAEISSLQQQNVGSSS
ncbi:Stage 0 sporulation protein [Trichinella spiralis]|uniref:Stage 0 sporulation protein n=1 Tax=Trichinella spiralis TaxID=6334 RepID=A0ABR3KX65_TRISP